MLRLFVINFLLSLYLVSTQEIPGLKLRITKKGLDYINQIAEQVLTREIKAITINDFTKEFRRGKVTAKHMKISHFSPAVPTFQLSSPNRVTWRLQSESLEVEGEWNGKYKKYIKIRGSGDFETEAKNVDVSLSFSLRRNSAGNPEAYDIASTVQIGRLEVEISGGIVGKILNKFRDNISDRLKPILEQKLMEIVTKFGSEDLNRKLSKILQSKKLQEILNVDYSLTNDPQVGSDYLEISHKGDKNRDYVDRYSTPFQAHPITRSSAHPNTKMLYMWASDYVLNSWFYHAHHKNMSVLESDSISSPKLAGFLDLNCPFYKICLGSMFPDIASLYPDSKAKVLLRTTTVPEAIFFKNGATLSSNVSIDVSINGTYGTVPLLSIYLHVSTNLSIYVNDSRLKGEVIVDQLAVKSVETDFPELEESASLVQMILDWATPLVEDKINEIMARGVRFPGTEETKLINTEVKLLPRTLEIGTDVVYDLE